METLLSSRNVARNYVYVLCEGVFDLLFIERYLIQKGKYRKESNAERYYQFENGEAHSCLYNADKNVEIDVFSMGGIDKINAFFERYIRKKLDNPDVTYGIVVVIDADDSHSIAASKIAFEGIQLEERDWTKGNLECREWSNGYSHYFAYLSVIPFREKGALETVLINALAKQEKEIVTSAVKYVDGLPSDGKESQYIRKPRLKLKAKLGVALELVDPVRLAEKIQALLKRLSLNEEPIQEHFGFLLDIPRHFPE